MMWKKVFIGFVVLTLGVFAFLAWYKFHYSMDIAEAFEVNTPELNQKILIATQGSEFKDAIVAGVVDHLKQRNTYIKVIDVTALPQVNQDKWTAVVVIHTWESGEPQVDAKAYLVRVDDLSKVVVLSTSGQGESKMNDVDAITSGSVMDDIPLRVLDITMRLDSILDGNTHN